MRKSVLIAALGLMSLAAVAQDGPKEEGFVFTTVKENPITSIKDQHRSSTCWSFSSLGFLEAELLRMGKGTYDFSEMFVVHHTMVDRAVNYVRYHGDASFSPGGSFYDIMFCLKNYGLVPQEAMPGIMYGDSLPVHTELDAVAGAYVQAIGKGRFAVFDIDRLPAEGIFTVAHTRGTHGIADGNGSVFTEDAVKESEIIGVNVNTVADKLRCCILRVKSRYRHPRIAV